jgi:hypothetical protein
MNGISGFAEGVTVSGEPMPFKLGDEIAVFVFLQVGQLLLCQIPVREIPQKPVLSLETGSNKKPSFQTESCSWMCSGPFRRVRQSGMGTGLYPDLFTIPKLSEVIPRLYWLW